jgi:hypothetical protein
VSFLDSSTYSVYELNVMGTLFRRSKRPRSETEIKNAWMYMFTSPYAFTYLIPSVAFPFVWNKNRREVPTWEVPTENARFLLCLNNEVEV